jgi:hypothetical protein
MHDDERHAESEQRPPVFAVAPVRTRHAVPREVLVALVVGVIAFVGGMLIATRDTADQARADARAAASAPVSSQIPASPVRPPAPNVPSGPPAGTTPASVAAVPGSSAFVRDFRPDALVTGLPHGADCVTSSRQKEVPRTLRDGPRMTFARSWTIYCPLKAKSRQSFLLALIMQLVGEVPAETYGYSANLDGSGDALLPYAEYPLAGTVALTADSAGPGFSISIVLEEWRSG